ncbi:MAG: glycosyltransferase [Gammaproteobacteria bacterium]
MAHYSLERDAILTGWIERADFPALSSLADVFLLPSFYEGFGIPLIEAMACGCPVVTSTKGSCPFKRPFSSRDTVLLGS